MNLLSKLRSYRIGPFAIFDFASTFGAVWLGAPFVKDYISRERMLYLAVPAGVLAHLLLGIDTPLHRILFTGDEASWAARLAIAALTIKGIAPSIKTSYTS